MIKLASDQSMENSYKKCAKMYYTVNILIKTAPFAPKFPTYMSKPQIRTTHATVKQLFVQDYLGKPVKLLLSKDKYHIKSCDVKHTTDVTLVKSMEVAFISFHVLFTSCMQMQ